MKRVRVDGPVMGEVEAQSLRFHQTALLPDMGPEMLAERVVHEMRGAVVALDVVPPRRIDRRVRRIGIEGLLERAANDGALGILSDGIHRQRPTVTAERTDIADLATGLDVERVLVEHDLDPWPLLTEREDVGVRLGARIADELLLSPFDGAPLARLCDVDGGAGTFRATVPVVRASRERLPLLFQLPLEPLEIHLHPALARDDLGQVDGKSEGVIELERLFTGDAARAGGEDLLQPPSPPSMVSRNRRSSVSVTSWM